MGARLERMYSIEDLRNAAKKRLPRAVFDFYDGGSQDELTLGANHQAFKKSSLLPRILRPVDEVDPTTTILGHRSAYPIVVAPMGGMGIGWPDGDIALARAASEAGIPYTLSSASNNSLEEVARSARGRLWFQPYMLKQREFVYQLIDRAYAADYEALVVTLDMPTGGKRERDLRNQFGLPFRLTPSGFLDFASRPMWSLDMLRRGVPRMGNMVGYEDSAASATRTMATLGRSADAAMDADQLRRVRDRWPRKLIVKGVMHPDDATYLADIGCDAMVVSNHGGRQYDGCPSSLAMLPYIVKAVSGRSEVLLDGGIRRGRHALQAVALGAQAVLVGRAVLYGTVAAGESGARRAIEILADEIVRDLRLCGTRNIEQVREHAFWKHQGDGEES
ncbi:alpha-hydroxy-acid oxidizing protein [Hydrogenophaga sp. BPS33]|nr:alpha-hydroxy-acid oxidizing protein [Hydrogenophaga sp. BPS33]